MEKAASGWEDDCARRLVDDGFPTWQRATESELSRMRLRMCAWCEARVRCVFGTGKRDVREIGTWEEV